MCEVAKDEKCGEEGATRKPEPKGDHSYYYDDAHGYEDYDPEGEDDSEECSA